MTMNSPNTATDTQNSAEYRPVSGLSAAELAALWEEARLAYPLYAALAEEFKLAPGPYPAGELPPARPTRSAFSRDLKWLDAIDEQLFAYQMRQLRPGVLNGSEPGLRAFIQRQLRAPRKTAANRDKVDWLLVQYFALCASEELYRNEISLADVARVLRPVLTAEDATPPECCGPLEDILGNLSHCRSLRDILENGLLEQGRLLKNAAGAKYYEPAALVAFCRFSFLLRRAFIRLLHADLSTVKEAIDALEAKRVRTVDCRRAGFSAAETTAQLRYFCENWRQPFQKDYTEHSVTRSFEQLLALRADLEEALGRIRQGDSAESTRSAREERTSSLDFMKESAATVGESMGFGQASSALAASDEDPPITAHSAASAPPPMQAAHRNAQARLPTDLAGPAGAEECLKAISEQLAGASPSHNGVMSTVTLDDTKVLLSSWEAAAFAGESNEESQDLRRAVVARLLLAIAMDRRKRSGEENALACALSMAHTEVLHFQNRIEQAKSMNDMEAAVNLGISTKRLLSFIDDAEQLQP